MNGISVIIPSIPPRQRKLSRALLSVQRQTLLPDAVHIAYDLDKQGAGITRDRALAAVATEFVAPLDDDDELYPDHLEALRTHLLDTDADLVYPWFDVLGGTDPFPQFFGKPWDDSDPHQTTVTVLARTESLRAVGGYTGDEDLGETDSGGNRAGEEYRMVLRMVAKGMKIVHLPLRTFRWHHWQENGQGNTSGLADRW